MLPTPIAGIAIGLVSLDFAWALHGVNATQSGLRRRSSSSSEWRGWHIGFDLMLLSIAGGLFIVPAFAAVQAWAKPDHRARVVAGVNVLSALFMVAGSVAVGALEAMPA